MFYYKYYHCNRSIVFSMVGYISQTILHINDSLTYEALVFYQ